MDAANMLKPALARGELRCVGATTLTNTANISKRMRPWSGASRPVLVDEPTRGRHHLHPARAERSATRCTTASNPRSAIVAAADLSHRYITDRFLPDKAIDLMDECASNLRIEIDSVPDEDRRDRTARSCSPKSNAKP
jgi:ATP-dependent Clp protease ATP-binding subunit ClpB